MHLQGRAGTAFLENTWGIHRAAPLVARDRFIFSAMHSLTSMNAQAPVKRLWVDLEGRGPFDPYVNRVCLKSRP